MVWQDFISAQKNEKNPTKEESDKWLQEQKQMMIQLYNHPSIIMWTVFNEAWGQHRTEEIFNWTTKQDTTRLITLASGWTDIKNEGDIRDIHDYTFRPSIPVLGSDNRVLVIGEGGGFASAVPNHNWLGRSNKSGPIRNPLYGGFNPDTPRDDNYAHDVFRPTFTMGEAFEKQYARFADHLKLLKNSGLNAIVYTQLTDMKREENGWLTFDRKVSKIDVKALNRIHSELIEGVQKQKIILGNSAITQKKWMVANLPFPKKDKEVLDAVLLQTPPDFDNINWAEGFAPFGNIDDSGRGISWGGKEQLLIKNSFTFEELSSGISVRVYAYLEGDTPWMHARIYINGVFVADEIVREKMPENRMAEVIVPKEKMYLLHKGLNSIIIQFIPGLTSQSGNMTNFPQNISVDAEVTTFNPMLE